jgi:hypothetical protein
VRDGQHPAIGADGHPARCQLGTGRRDQVPGSDLEDPRLRPIEWRDNHEVPFRMHGGGAHRNASRIDPWREQLLDEKSAGHVVQAGPCPASDEQERGVVREGQGLARRLEHANRLRASPRRTGRRWA